MFRNGFRAVRRPVPALPLLVMLAGMAWEGGAAAQSATEIATPEVAWATPLARRIDSSKYNLTDALGLSACGTGQVSKSTSRGFLCVSAAEATAQGVVCASDQLLTSDGATLSCVAKPPVFVENQSYSATCTSKAGNTQTVTGYGARDVLIARAPSNMSTWVIFPQGPYLNCFDSGGYSPELDFAYQSACVTYAHTPGYGRYLAYCSWR